MKYNVLPHKNFTEEEIQDMKHLMAKEKNLALHGKYQAVYLHMTGKSNKDIAQIIGRNEATVSIYLHTYFEKGLEALVPVKQSGRPSRLTREQLDILKETVTTKTPHDVGFNYAYNWTAKLVSQWVEKTFGVHYSNCGMQKILHQENLTYTRPTYHLEKANKEKQQEFTEKLDAFKKN